MEEVALDAYREKGFQALFTESRVYRMLFRLLFWREIMDELVPGAFVCPLGRGGGEGGREGRRGLPLDVEHAYMFYVRRKGGIEGRLAELDQLAARRSLGREVRRCWDRHCLALWEGGREGGGAVGGCVRG